MSILSRFGDIISSNINALLDKCEDPAKMVDQYLRNAMDDLAEVKKDTAAVMAEERRCKRLLDDATEDVTKYDGLAMKAIQAGNDNDARVFIGKKQEAENNAATAQKAYDIASANASKMRQLHDKLTTDIEALRSRKANIKATMAVVEAQDKVNKMTANADSARSAIAGFERMEEKANRMLDETMAMADLSVGADDTVEDLEKKYGGAGSVSVDDELAAMKARLNGGQA